MNNEVKVFWKNYFKDIYSIPIEHRKKYMYQIKYLEKLQDSADLNSYDAFQTIFDIYKSNSTFDDYKKSKNEEYNMIIIVNKFMYKEKIFEILKKIMAPTIHIFYTKEEYMYLKNNGFDHIPTHLRHLMNNRYRFEDECKNAVSSTHIYLLNKLLISIYQKWDTNYDLYITQNKDHINIKNKWYHIISNHKLKNRIKKEEAILYDKLPTFFINADKKLLSSYTFESSDNKCDFSLLLSLKYEDDYDTIYEIWNCLYHYLDNNDDAIDIINLTNIDNTNDVNSIQEKVSKEKVTKEKVSKKKVVKEKVNDNSMIIEEPIVNEETINNKMEIDDSSFIPLECEGIAATFFTPPEKKVEEKVIQKKVKKGESKNENGDVKKYKKEYIPAALKRKVWAQWVGEDIGKTECLCCGLTSITQLSFHCGHIVSEAKGGKLQLDNLKPICQGCNSSMGTKDMNEFMTQYGF